MAFIKKTILVTILLTSFLITLITPLTVQGELEAEPLFTLNWVGTSGSPEIEIAQMIKEEFAKIGVDVQIHTFDSATVVGRTWGLPEPATFEEGGTDLSLYGTFTMGSDYVWYLGMYSSGGINPNGWQFWSWKNGVADRYLENAMSTYDRAERVENMHLWQDETNDDAASIFLYNPTRMYLSRSDLRGYHPPYFNSDVDLWTLEGKTQDDDVTIQVRITSDVAAWLTLYVQDWDVLSVMYRGLYSQKWTSHGFDVVPDMAESFEVSEDGLTITFNLREDVKWHDGEPCTSADVKFTYDTILNPDVGSAFYWDFSSAVESVEAPDDYTVVLHLWRKAPEIFALLAATDSAILPKHVLGDIPIQDLRTSLYNTETPPPGTGPMKFVKWVRGDYVEFEAFDDFYLGQPFVDHLILRLIPDDMTALAALEAGELDVPDYYLSDSVQSEADRLRAEAPQLNATEYQAVSATMIIMNHEHPALASRTVRKALSYAVPYDKIFELLGGFAVPLSSYVPPNTWGFNPDTPYYTLDLEKAKELLSEAGYPDWPPPEPEIPPAINVPQLLGGLVAGLVIGFVATWLLKK